MNFLEKINLANKELRKQFGKEVKIIGRCDCCYSCTFEKLRNKMSENYIIWGIFLNGVNKNIEELKNGSLNEVYGSWNLTDEQLTTALSILSQYFIIKKPKNDTESLCIKLQGNFENE